MLTLKEVKETTDKIFDEGQGELQVPEPPFIWKERLEALEEAKLDQQRNSALFDMRCWQAEHMGFKRMETGEFVKMLMGDEHTNSLEREDIPRQTYEWFYNHHTGITLEGNKCNWGGHPMDFYRLQKPNYWYFAPFNKIEKWRCRFGKLDYLKRTIPYGVILRINELKKLNLFNVFNVIAPLEAWERKTDIDPIVLATIWSIEGNKAGQIAHFFVAQW